MLMSESTMELFAVVNFHIRNKISITRRIYVMKPLNGTKLSF